jgi:hypothetical protein
MQAKKITNKLTIYSKSILVITVVFLMQACTADKNGAGTPDRVVEQYLLALEDRDQSLMLRLAPEHAVVAGAVKARIMKQGGHKIQNRQISYIKSTSSLWSAKIRGFYVDRSGIRRNFDDSISIEYQGRGQVKLYGGRWYLLL